MSSTSGGDLSQGLRDRARSKHWKRFDENIMTLIAMDASPTDLENRLRSVLDGNMGLTEMIPKATPPIKIENDESLSNGSFENMMQATEISREDQKRKASEATNTETLRNKRLSSIGSPDVVELGAANTFPSDPPPHPYVNAEPTTGARFFFDEKGVVDGKNLFPRDTVGWQFREFNGIAKV